MAAPGPTVVLLVRHGLTETTGRLLPGRAPGLHLSDDGRRQAETAAKRIAAVSGIAAVHASPLERARETAAPIARDLGVKVSVNAGVVEGDVGAWTGLDLRRLRRRPEWHLVQRHPSGFRFPGGESFVEIQARAVSTIARLVERHRGGTIVVVSHADPIKLIVAHALGLPLDLFQRIAIAPASVTAIAYRSDAPMILVLNAVDGDLAPLGR